MSLHHCDSKIRNCIPDILYNSLMCGLLIHRDITDLDSGEVGGHTSARRRVGPVITSRVRSNQIIATLCKTRGRVSTIPAGLWTGLWTYSSFKQLGPALISDFLCGFSYYIHQSLAIRLFF